MGGSWFWSASTQPILLTGRNIEKDIIEDDYSNRIKASKTVESLRISSKSEQNIGVLKNYIKACKIGGLSDESINELITASDNKLLCLTMLCNLMRSGENVGLDFGSTRDIVFSYLSTIDKYYGESKRHDFNMLLAIIAVIGKYEPVSLREIADLLSMGNIKLMLLGILADIAPLLSIERSFSINGFEYTDVNRYHFANEDIGLYVKEYLGETLFALIKELIDNARFNLCSNDQFAVEGTVALTSHLADILAEFDFDIQWDSEHLKGMSSLINLYKEVANQNGLMEYRVTRVARQMIDLSERISQTERDKAITPIIDAYLICFSIPNYTEDRYMLLFQFNKVVESANYPTRLEEAYNLCRFYTTQSLEWGDGKSALKAIGYMESVEQERKTNKMMEAQADAYKALLCADEDSFDDYDSQFDKEDVALKAVTIAELLESNVDSKSEIKYTYHYMNYATILANSENAASIKKAKRYMNKCIDALEKIEISRELSPAESMLLFDAYIKRVCLFDIDDIQESNKAFILLKKVYRKSVYITHEWLISSYDQLMNNVMHMALEKNQQFWALCEECFINAMDVINTIVATDNSYLGKKVDFLISYAYLFVQGNPKSNIIDASVLFEQAICECKKANENGNQIDKYKLARLYGFYVLCMYQDICKNQSMNTVDAFLSRIDEAISHIEEATDDEEGQNNVYLCKAWFFKWKISMISQSQYGNKAIDSYTIRYITMMTVYLLITKPFPPTEINQGLQMRDESLRYYITIVEKELLDSYYRSLISLTQKYPCSKMNKDEAIDNIKMVKTLIEKQKTQEALYLAECTCANCYHNFGENSSITRNAIVALRDIYIQLKDHSNALQFSFNAFYLDHKTAQTDKNAFSIFLNTLLDCIKDFGEKEEEKRLNERNMGH